jgi:signal transduction histidine kinase
MPSELSTDRGDQSVEELRRELAEAREQQAAAAEILRVISSSPTDLKHVFAVVAANAARLCDANDAQIRQVDGSTLHLVAQHGSIPSNPVVTATRGLASGRAVLECRTVQIADMHAVADEYPEGSDIARRLGYRTFLAVPLIRAGNAVGVINVRRAECRPFSDRQIDLLKTFADQAVIAIENTRLFEAEQASKREVQESLKYQTATSDVLGVISRSAGELEPVLQTVVETAAKICGADRAAIFRLRDGNYHMAASIGFSEEFRAHHAQDPTRPGRGTVTGRVSLTRGTVHIPDAAADPEYAATRSRELGETRSMLGVPLLRDGAVIGVIFLARPRVEPFSDKEIVLVTTFADQAVIAIENTRLFTELRESLQQQTATADVLKVISRSTFDLQAVLDTLVKSAHQLCAADKAFLFHYDGTTFSWGTDFGFSPEYKAYILDQLPHIRPGRGTLVGRVAIERATVHIPDPVVDPEATWREAWQIGQTRTMLGVPLLREGALIGVLGLLRSTVRPFTSAQIELVTTFADQAVIAIENVRLFDQIQDKSRELEIASQHKSQFVANMSHELRTPLAAILGYAELMQEGFYEPLGQKSMDALTRIRSNGKHLLGLINTVLDIAKIESGQFTLNMTEYAIESVVETVRAATESLAQNKKLTLTTSVDKSLPVGLGDEQRLTQVLLNLVGNAIKFTDAGEVRVTAKAVNGNFAVSVTDTGPGIPQEHQGRIFEHFHQVDSSLTKAKGGTGLGLAIAKDIVEMHGGRIWVESTVGKGSTFQMEIPTRAEFRKRAL